MKCRGVNFSVRVLTSRLLPRQKIAKAILLSRGTLLSATHMKLYGHGEVPGVTV